jgi:hypothetical protein
MQAEGKLRSVVADAVSEKQSDWKPVKVEYEKRVSTYKKIAAQAQADYDLNISLWNAY